MAINTSFSANLNQNLNVLSAATTNATLVKASVSAVITVLACNNGAAAAFVKFFDKATAPVTGTDTPIAVIPVPATSTVSINVPITCRLGLGYAITNLIADLDNTAVVAGQVKLCIQYV